MKRTREILIVDLDDTLVDTSSFKEKLFSKLAGEFNLSYLEIEKIYSRCKQDGYEDLSSRFCSQIAKISNNNFQRCSDILFLEIESLRIRRKILNYVKNFLGYKLLLTLGDPKIQRAKINFLEGKVGLSSLFDRIKIISCDKFGYIRSLIKNSHLKFDNRIFDKVLILDDRESVFRKFENYSWVKILDPDKV